VVYRWKSGLPEKKSKKHSDSTKHGFYQLLSETVPRENSTLSSFLLFPEKEAKSVVPLRGKLWAPQPSAKPTQGVWGRAPRNSIDLLM
jgi:hypothetical protein